MKKNVEIFQWGDTGCDNSCPRGDFACYQKIFFSLSSCVYRIGSKGSPLGTDGRKAPDFGFTIASSIKFFFAFVIIWIDREREQEQWYFLLFTITSQLNSWTEMFLLLLRRGTICPCPLSRNLSQTALQQVSAWLSLLATQDCRCRRAISSCSQISTK